MECTKAVLDEGTWYLLGVSSHFQEPLPAQPLSGMLNKYGAKVRLYFKLEQDQLWIGTKGKVLFLR